MSGRVLNELLRRRIPQVTGIYLAAGWGLLEFTQWAATEFGFGNGVVLWLAAILALFLPLTLAAAWRLGGSTRAGAGMVPGTSAPSPPPARSIAVLPFSDLTPGSTEP